MSLSGIHPNRWLSRWTRYAGPPTQDVSWLPDEREDYCSRCGATGAAHTMGPDGCPFCMGQRLPWHRVTRLTEYVDPMDEWIRTMKYEGQWRIASWLGTQLAKQVGEALPGGERLVVWVPMHWTRRWRRGYDQAQLIAKALAREGGWECEGLLSRIRRTTRQTWVAPSQRQANVSKAFRMASVDLTGYDVILVDDVKTSGATLSQCARLLKQHNARSIHVAVASVGDPKHQNFAVI